MFESIYVGLTGLMSFSRQLTVLGNNVSNLNSTGFKASQLEFSDLMYARHPGGNSNASLQLGAGVDAGATYVQFTQGALRDTGNPSDLAINGNGFFVLRADGKSVYTRAGNFEFDADGFLVSRTNRARVAALSGGALQDFSIARLRATPAQATSVVRLVDNLSTGDTSHELTATLFDASGTSRDLTLAFTNNNGVEPRSWLVEVRDAAGSVLAKGEVRFNGDGSPAEGFNKLAFQLAPAGVPATQVTLDFGEPGSFAGSTEFSAGTDSTLRVASQDGFAAGALTGTQFGADGVVVASYSNGRTAKGPQLALAFFESPQSLEEAGAAMFENRSGQRVELGAPQAGLFGALAAGSLESANVDLAQQFSELIITQRGYQASSQVISAANDMLQQLFDIKAKR
jgi:flagellar hook protein FlgE